MGTLRFAGAARRDPGLPTLQSFRRPSDAAGVCAKRHLYLVYGGAQEVAVTLDGVVFAMLATVTLMQFFN